MLRQVAARIAQSFGYVVMPQWRADIYHFVNHLQKLFRHADIDCVLDVGANSGQFRNFIRYGVGFQGPLVSFEPDPSLVSKITERAKADRRWHIHPYALGSEPGTLTLNLMKSSGCNSFLTPDHRFAPTMTAANTIVGSVSVPVHTLDEVFPAIQREIGCKRVYLKMDTQGFDIEVIKGATETLRHVRVLQTEASVKPLYHGMTDYATVIRNLQERGFDLSGIFPVNDYTFPMMAEFDAVFVRQ